MNFVDVIAHADGETWRLDGDGICFRVSRERFDLHEGRAITLGVRPSALVAGQVSEGASNRLAGVIDLVEFHGDDALVSFRVSGKEISALVPASSRPSQGAPVVFLGQWRETAHLRSCDRAFDVAGGSVPLAGCVFTAADQGHPHHLRRNYSRATSPSECCRRLASTAGGGRRAHRASWWIAVAREMMLVVPAINRAVQPIAHGQRPPPSQPGPPTSSSLPSRRSGRPPWSRLGL